ncbi:hypothetical protein GGI35DRAFT_115813 [Trichoderma velutinum]
MLGTGTCSTCYQLPISSSYQSGSRHVSAGPHWLPSRARDRRFGLVGWRCQNLPQVSPLIPDEVTSFFPNCLSPTNLLVPPLHRSHHSPVPLEATSHLSRPRRFAFRHSLFPSLLHAAPESKLVTELEQHQSASR